MKIFSLKTVGVIICRSFHEWYVRNSMRERTESEKWFELRDKNPELAMMILENTTKERLNDPTFIRRFEHRARGLRLQ